MKKFYSFLILALVAMLPQFAMAIETVTVPVKMTYVDGGNVDAVAGEVAEATLGYMKIVNGEIACANAGWGVNNIAYLEVDASAIEGVITKVTLDAVFNDNTGGKRNVEVCVGYNNSVWSDALKWNDADRTVTKVGDSFWAQRGVNDQAASFDVTAAFKGENKKVTLLMYTLTAAGTALTAVPTVNVTYANADEITTYTVKYVDANGNELKEATVHEGALIGAEVAALAEEMEAFKVEAEDGKVTKWICKATDVKEGEEVITPAITLVQDPASNVLNIEFREAVVATLRVRINGKAYKTINGLFEGDNYTFWMPYYTFREVTPDEGEPYQGFFNLTDSRKDYGKFTYTLTKSKNQTYDIEYTEEENSNCVFYKEAEEIEGLTAFQDGYTEIRMSNGAAAYAAEDGTVVATVEPGAYSIEAATRAGNTYFSVNGNQVLALESSGSVINPVGKFQVKNAAEITVSAGNEKNYFDYILIRRTGDYVPVAADVEIAPEAGDITAAVNEAIGDADYVGNLTVTLAEGAAYTVSGTLQAAGNVLINGNGATIDASELAAPFITLDGTTKPATQIDAVAEDGTIETSESTSFKAIESVQIDGVKITGLAKALVRDNQKTLVDYVLVNNSNIEVVGNSAIFDFSGKGYPTDLKVLNSTLWSKEGHGGFFAQLQNRLGDVDKTKSVLKETISVENSTLYNISYGKKMNNLNQRGQTWLTFELKNSILYNVSTADPLNGWNGGQDSTNPTMVYANNTYWSTDGEVAVWTDESKNTSDKTGTALKTDPSFKDAANGDFTVGADTEQAKLMTGDPRWAATVEEPVYTLGEIWNIESDEAVEVNVKVENAKVTYYNDNFLMGFIEDETGAACIVNDYEVEGLATGKAFTGTIKVQVIPAEGLVFPVSLEGVETADVDVTTGVEVASVDDLANVDMYRLVTVSNVPGEYIYDYFGLYGEDDEFVGTYKSVTGILFGEYILPRFVSDIVAGEPEVQATTYIVSWESDMEKANAVTTADGVKVQITGNVDKQIQSGNAITLPDGTTKTAMKVSNGAQNTITLPVGMYATKVTFYSYVNKSADAIADARTSYWKEVDGVVYTEETATVMTCPSDKPVENPDVATFTIANKNSFTYTNAGEQVVYVAVIEAVETTTGISSTVVYAPATDAIFNLAGQKVDAQYKGIVIKNGKKFLNK